MEAMNLGRPRASEASGTSGTVAALLDRKGAYVVSVDPDCTVSEAVKVMCRTKVGAVIVFEHQVPVGLFTERDVMHRVVAVDADPKSMRVKEVMTSPFASGTPDLEIHEAAEMMSQNRIRHLPVMQGGQLMGVISSGDILAWKLHSNESMMRHMEDYFFRH